MASRFMVSFFSLLIVLRSFSEQLYGDLAGKPVGKDAERRQQRQNKDDVTVFQPVNKRFRRVIGVQKPRNIPEKEVGDNKEENDRHNDALYLDSFHNAEAHHERYLDCEHEKSAGEQ